MGKSEKRKGTEAEREIVKKLQDRGVNCIRIPMSGSIWSWKGDIDFFNGIKGEVKRRKRINKLFYKMLLNVHFGFIRADHEDWIVTMGLDEFAEMYKAWKDRKLS